jgi:hypothetical protein
MVNDGGKKEFDDLLKAYASLDESAETLIRTLKRIPANARHKLIAELRNLEKRRLELLDQMDDLKSSGCN